jgi:putative flippase GtrA
MTSRFDLPHERQSGPIARKRIARFIAVGCVAAAVHWGVVVGLVDHLGWQPLLANLIGWVVAFSMSFTGHHKLTFDDSHVPIRSSIWRFFFVSAFGFFINEMSYALLLHWSKQPYDLILGIVLISVAGITYLLSRHWVFFRTEAG